MPSNGGNITFGIDFNVNKSGLNDLKKSLQEIQRATTKDLVGNLGSDQAKKALEEAKRSAAEVEQALKKAYNPTLGTTNVSKFNQELKNSGTSLNQVYQNFSKIQGGTSVFRNMATDVLTTNMQLKQTNSLLDSMGKTMINTVKWGIASSIMNSFTGSVQNAFNYVKALDSSLTDIRIVTGDSRDQMDRFAKSANQAAQSLGRQTKEYTNAALAFYQQGLGDEEVAARTETTLKASNITGADVASMADQLTAVWNGFQVQGEKTNEVVSKLAAVADTSASNMSELATAMSKSASIANNMGVNVDQLGAQIATIIATTRQAPQTVGNALKTIYARINDIKAGTDQAEISLGNYTGKMAQLGVNVLDQNGQLRDTGQVMEEIGQRWGSMTREQQVYLAQTMAGQRQMNNLIALFDNWDMYTKELNISLEAQGTLDQKNARYMESLAAHTKEFQTAQEGLIQAFANGDSFKGFIDLGTQALNLLTKMVDSIGGGGTAILGLGSILTKVFSKQISSEISSLVLNFEALKNNASTLAAQKEITSLFDGVDIKDDLAKKFVDLKKQALEFGDVVTSEQHNVLNSLITERNELENQSQAWKQDKKDAKDFYEAQGKGDIGNLDDSDQNFDKVLSNLKRLQKQTESTITTADSLSKAFSEDSFDGDIESTMSTYIEKAKELAKNQNLDKSVQDALTGSVTKYIEVLKKAKESGATPQDLLDNEDLTSGASQVLSTISFAEQHILQGAQKTSETVKRASAGTTQKIESDITDCEKRTGLFFEKVNTKVAIQGFVKLASSVSQMTFAFQSLNNISKVFKDDTIPAGEKATQIITGLAMALPMLKSGVTGALQGIKSLGVAFGVAGASSTSLLAAVGSTLVAFAPYIAAVGALTTTIYLLVKAHNAQADAAKAAAKTAQETQSRYESLKNSYSELKKTIEDYQEGYKALSKMTSKTEEWNDKVKQLNETILELISKYPQLAKQVTSVNGQLRVSEDAFKNILAQQQKIVDLAQADSLAAQIHSNRASEQAKLTQTGRGITYLNGENADGEARAATVSKDILRRVLAAYEKNNNTLLDANTLMKNTGITNESLAEALIANRDELIPLATLIENNTQSNRILGEQIAHAYNEASGNQRYASSQYKGVIDSIIDERFQQVLPKFQQIWRNGNGKTDKQAQEAFATSREDITGSKNKFGNMGQYYTKEGGSLTFQDSYVRDQVARNKAMEAVLKDQDSVITSVEQAAKEADKISKNSAKILAAYSENRQRIDLTQFAIEDIQSFSEALKAGMLNNAITAFGLQAGNDFIESFNSVVDPYLKGFSTSATTDIEKSLQDVRAELESSNDLSGFLKSLRENGTLSKDQLKKLGETIDLLMQQFPELSSQIAQYGRVLKNEGLVNTDEFKRSLKELDQTISQTAIKDLQEKTKWQPYELVYNVRADKVEQFENHIDQYCAAQKELDIIIESNINEIFDQINNSLDGLENAASKIGEDFVVSFDDLKTVSDIFPGILQGMQDLGNGTVQLNQEVARSIIGQITEVTAQELQGNMDRIQSQISVLKAKQESARIAAQEARAMAEKIRNGEEVTAQERQHLADTLSNVQQKDSDKAATKTISDQADMATSADTNGQLISDAIGNAATSMNDSMHSAAQNSIKYLNAVGEAAKTVQSGGQVAGSLAKIPVARGTYTSTGGGVKTPLSQQIEEVSNDINAGREIAAQGLQELADSLDEMVSDADSAIAKMYDEFNIIGARSNQIANGIKGATSGKGYSSGSGGKGGGGGGGGKDKTKSAEEIDKLKLKDQDVDKYHQIERAIKRIDDYLDAMSGYEEKAIRGAKSDTIDKQVDALQQQKALYEQKIQMMQADLQLQQADLQLLGVQFDEQGNIINYTALMSAYQAQYNALLEQAKLLTGDAQENKLKEASNLKQQLESLKSQMGAYESLQDKIMDAGSAIRDIIDKEEELRIKQFKIKIDTELDFADAKRDWNEFKKEVIDKIKDDDFLGQARARVQDFFSYYDDQGNGIIQKLTEHVNRTREEAEIIENGGTSSIYGKNQAQALEDLKHYTDELMQNLKDVQEIAEDIHDLYLDTIDKAQDAFDEQIDQYEQIDGIIEHDMNLLQLLSPENNEEQLAHYYDQRAKNHNQEIDFYRKEADMWKVQMENAEEGTEEWKKFRDNWEASINDLNSAVESAVENLINKYENTISKIIKETKNQIMGGDWQKAMDEWDRAKWNDDRYLDMGSRVTGVLDFMDKVNEAMNGQSPKVQKQLNEFLEKEVGYLNEIPNLRQIDLDIAYKKLEVLQKQMALEDAQEAKTRMRLRRDSQGNYTYQYVADEDQIATKQQQLRDTLEELRQLAKVDISDTMDEVQEKLDEFFEHAQELSQTYYDDQDLLQQKLLELQNEYFGEEGYITLLGMDYHTMQEQLLTATGAQFSVLLGQMGNDLQAFLGLDGENASDQAVWTSILALLSPDGGKIPTLFDAFVKDVYLKNFALMSEQNQNLLFGSETGLNPSWNTAIGNMAENYMALTRDVVIPCMQAMIDANAVYANDLNILQQVAGVSFGTIAQGIDADIAYTQGLIQANDALVDTYNAQMNAIAGVCAQIANLCAQYSMAEQAAIDAANAALKFWFAANGQTIGDYYSGGTPHATAAAPASAPVSSGSSSGGSGGGNSSGGRSTQTSTTSKPDEYFMVKGANGEAVYYQYAGNGDFSASPINRVSAQTASQGTIIDRNTYAVRGDSGSHVEGLDSSVYKYDYNRNRKVKTTGGSILAFATGGYTGEWTGGSQNGRIALLHQKELVLNAEDTINMLNAVKIASGMMERIAGLNSSVLDNLVANRGLSNIETGGTVDSSSHQVINIQADFPNANSADEIKQAFNNLINIASQRASGNRRTY